MVTGDHAGTAASVSREVGLLTPDGHVLEGQQLGQADPAEVSVFARVKPEDKLAIVRALQERGEVVAVTGDGVNDAPALRQADIGVAMGRTGSDVAREAADMVITDDNLGTIVHAVEEGRGLVRNIRNVIDYLVAGNLSEVAVVVTVLLLFSRRRCHAHAPADPLDQPPHRWSSGGGSRGRVGFRGTYGPGGHLEPAVVAESADARGAWDVDRVHVRGHLRGRSVRLRPVVRVRTDGDVHRPRVVASALRIRRLPGSSGRNAGTAPCAAGARGLLIAVGTGIVLQAAVVAFPVFHDVFDTTPSPHPDGCSASQRGCRAPRDLAGRPGGSRSAA